MNFLKAVFSESGEGSAARVMMAFHAVVGSVWVFHHLVHGHPLAEVPWTGVTSFVCAPYAINKAQSAIAAFGSKSTPAT